MNGSLAGPPLAVWSSRAYPGGIMGPSESWEEAIPPSPSGMASTVRLTSVGMAL